MRRIKLLVLTIIVINLVTMCTSTTFAETNENYSVSQYYGFVTLNQNGSISITEYISYDLENNTDSIKKIINMRETSGIDGDRGIQIFRITQIDQEDITQSEMEQVPMVDESGQTDEDCYFIQNYDEYNLINSLQINSEDFSQKETFVFKYDFNDVVSLYRDTAVLSWDFIVQDNNMKVDEVRIIITPPSQEKIDQYNIFVNGALYAEGEIGDDNLVYISANNITENEYLQALLLMPVSSFPDGRKILDNNKFDEIIDYQQSLAEENEELIKQIETKRLVETSVIAIFIILLAGIGCFIYIRYDRDPKTTIDEKNINGLPATYYTPAELGFFMRYGKINRDDFVATILHLVKRHFIDITKRANDENIYLKLRDDKSTNELYAHEEYLINWLFKDMGIKNEITLRDVINIFDTNQTKHENKIETWKSLLKKKAEKWNFYENVFVGRLVGFITGIIGIAGGVIVTITMTNYLGIFISIMGLALVIYSTRIYKRSEFGAIQNEQWLKFRKNMLVLLTKKIKKQDVIKWEDFFVYSIPLGISNDIYLGLKKSFKSAVFEDGNLTFMNNACSEEVMKILNYSQKSYSLIKRAKDLFLKNNIFKSLTSGINKVMIKK